MNNTLSILLVEDDEVTTFLARSTLKKMGMEQVDAVENGQLAYSYTERVCPDLILLDLNMPVMDGFEFLDLNEKEGQCEETRIVIMSSSNRQEDKDRAFGFDCVVDYVEKPLTENKVKSLLSNL